MIKSRLALALFLLPVFSAPGQEVEVPATDQKAEARASLRAWIFPGADKRPVALVVTLQEAPEPKVLAGTKDAAVTAQPGYASFSPGSMRIELKSGDEVLASQTGALRPERHYTAVAWSKGGKWQLQVFADDPASPNATDRPLRVVNFAGDRETLLAVDAGQDAKVAPDSVQEFRAPPKVAMVRVQVLSVDGGPPAQSSVEVDFASSPSAYVVVGPDYRGRMRPRVVQGGPPPPEPGAANGSDAQQ
jgi:hypothetical protein